MRLFLTVNMDGNIKDEIDDKISNLKRKYQGVRWVDKSNLHITTLFLGEISVERLDELKQYIKASVQGVKPFHLYAENIGVFPNFKRPNILWVGVNGNTEELKRLYYQVLQEINKMKLPIKEHSDFKPHITLARGINYFASDEIITLTTSRWEVNSLELYESNFTPKGVKYRRIHIEKFND